MSDDKKGNALTASLPVTAMLAILASWFFTSPSPYQEERPASRPLQMQYQPLQDVEARLWQDPFAAIDTVISQQKPNHQDTEHSVRQIFCKPEPCTPPSEETTILAVTLPGGSYQESMEKRMRRRYAVLSGLATQGFMPEDEQHIGYFKPQFQPASNDQMEAIGAGLAPPPVLDLQHYIPFEWLQNNGDHGQNAARLLLLWVDESSLIDTPFHKLKNILTGVGSASPATNTLFRYKVIGPNSSSILRSMIKEVAAASITDPCPQHKSDIQFYAAEATAADSELLHDIQLCAPATAVGAFFQQHGISLQRTTATDSAMLTLIADELKLRRVGVEDEVVLLSEWDTLYGRTMPKAFKAAFTKIFKLQADSNHIQSYSYMRGLDGRLPDKDAKSGEVTKKADGKDKANAEALIEIPQGTAQKDYLRRLSDQLLAMESDLKTQGKHKGIAAIGVLGSDVHDKLLILEALRQHFPHKLFFTTDLDAIYSHPLKLPQTHNLLVASAFDLALHPDLQASIPPFRDSYQTALFFSSMQAVSDQVVDAPSPRLFEIGRSRALALPTRDDTIKHVHADTACNSACVFQALLTDANTWALISLSLMVIAVGRRADFTFWGFMLRRMQGQPLSFARFKHNLRRFYRYLLPKYLFYLAYVAALLSWLYYINHFPLRSLVETNHAILGLSAHSKDHSLLPALEAHYLFDWTWQGLIMFIGLVCLAFLSATLRQVWRFYLSSVGLVMAILIIMRPWWSHHVMLPSLEPFFWFEGISVWPSQVPRLLVFIFAVCFYRCGSEKIHSTFKKVHQEEFFLPDKGIPQSAFNAIFVGGWNEANAGKHAQDDPNLLWSKYLGYFHSRHSCWRILIHWLLFFFMTALIVIFYEPPNVPTRDDCSMIINNILTFLAVFATTLLTIWVVENARLCERLIYNLSLKPSEWNDKAKDYALREHFVARDCVNDWLDIKLVAKLSESMQQLIWGPMACIFLLVLARIPFFDDWDIPKQLAVVFIALLLYAISAEVLLQRGAKQARAKAIAQLTRKIKVKRSRRIPDDAAIKRIEDEIERINSLREGAFRPWYELPLLQSFGGLSSVVLMVQYMAEFWGKGAF